MKNTVLLVSHSMEDIAKNKLGLVYPDEILIEPGNK